VRQDKLMSYQETRLLTAPPAMLAGIVLEESVKSIRAALGWLKAGDIPERSRAITKAMSLLAEFVTSLNDSASPELCTNLRRLCDYAHQRLMQAHVHQSAKMLQEVIDVIQPIAEAWVTVERRSATAV
jgi:flagellar protein FliS